MSRTAGTEVRAVTFDVGGTLIEPWPSVGGLYAEVAGRLGVGALDADGLDARFRAAWRTAHQGDGFDYSRRAWMDLVRATFSGLTGRAADPDLFGALWHRFTEPDAWRVFPDVVPCLEVLAARGLRIAVVSNWDGRLRPLLGRLGLADRFEFVVASAEIGAHKPSREIFVHAADRLGLPSSALMHVGDSFREDLDGARSAGWQALLVDRREASGPDRMAALTELPGRLLMTGISGTSPG